MFCAALNKTTSSTVAIDADSRRSNHPRSAPIAIVPSLRFRESEFHPKSTLDGGLSSPLHEISTTPPGIVTKRDFAIARSNSGSNMEYSEVRIVCCNCRKNLPSACKKCTAEKMSFRTVNLTLNRMKKDKIALMAEIEKEYGEQTSLSAKLNDARARLIGLRKEIQRRKALIREKREEKLCTSETLHDHKKRINGLKQWKEKNDAIRARKDSATASEPAAVVPYIEEMIEERTERCRQIFAIYPIKIHRAELQGSFMGEAPCIWDSVLPPDFLSSLPPNLSCSLNNNHALRSPLSLLYYSSQLVSLLAFILDLHLPKKMNARALFLTTFSADVLNSEWNSFCKNARFLCERAGIAVHTPRSPHNALISFFDLLCTKQVPKMGDKKRWPAWEEIIDPADDEGIENSSEWDICDDDDFRPSPYTANPFLR